MAKWTCGPIEFRSNHFAKAGDSGPGHAHEFPHATACIRGRLRVNAVLPDGAEWQIDLGPGETANVPAEAVHTMTALVDDTLTWCMFPHRNHKNKIVEAYMGWERAYAGAVSG